MKRFRTTGMLLALAAAIAVAPATAQIRNVTINTESDEGKLLQQAGDQTDPNAKIKILEEFLSKFASHDAVGYVHYQLQAEYLKLNNFDKSVQHGEAAQKKAPEDLELMHLLVKGFEGKADAERLASTVEKLHALAQKAAAAPKPADADEAEAWKRSQDFAGQLEQYNQHALFGTALKQSAPQAKVMLFDALRKIYPGGQFDKSLDAQYVVAYQQLGQHDKMLQAAETALAGDPTNEAYLSMLGESWLDPAKGKLPQSQANAEKILSTLPTKPKPDGIDEAAWAAHKNLYSGLANSLLGRGLANQGKWAPAHKALLAAVGPLKGNNDALAPVYYFLGFCSAKLERRKDALTYLSLASKIPSPYQAAAADMFKKISAALTGQ